MGLIMHAVYLKKINVCQVRMRLHFSFRDNHNNGHEDRLDQQFSFGTAAERLSTDIDKVSEHTHFKIHMTCHPLAIISEYHSGRSIYSNIVHGCTTFLIHVRDLYSSRPGQDKGYRCL